MPPCSKLHRVVPDTGSGTGAARETGTKQSWRFAPGPSCSHSEAFIRRHPQARFVYTLRDDVWLEDYVCGESHRDLSSVAGVRRP